MLAALLLALVDLLVALALRGLLPGRAAVAPGRWRCCSHCSCSDPSGPGRRPDDARIVELTRETHLAYVVTGQADVDQESEAGLKGLTRVLDADLDRGRRPGGGRFTADDLALFPLLYWPVPPDIRTWHRARRAGEAYSPRAA